VAAYDAAVKDAFAQTQSAIAKSVNLKQIPSNLNPPLAELGAQQFAILNNGCLLVVPFDTAQPECATGDTSSTTRVALVGDSRAAMYNPAFRQAATDRHWRLEMMAKASCPIVDLPVSDQFNSLAELFQRCTQWRMSTMARLRAERPQLIVVASSRAYDATGVHTMTPGLKMFDDAWLNGLTQLVTELRKTGAQVMVLGPSPDMPMPVPLCLSGHPDDITACAAPAGGHAHGIAVESAAVEAAGGRYVDVSRLFCTDARCPVVVGNTLLYFDAGHITREYSQFLAPAMGALADRALAGN